jgi:hypothetical protein
MLLALALATAAPSASEQAVSLFWRACLDGGMTATGAVALDRDEIPLSIRNRIGGGAAVSAWRFGEDVIGVGDYAKPDRSGAIQRCILVSNAVDIREASARIWALYEKRAYAPPRPESGTTERAVFPAYDQGWSITIRSVAGKTMIEATQFEAATAAKLHAEMEAHNATPAIRRPGKSK